MLKSSLCYYSDAYIHVKGKIRITLEGDNKAAKRADEINRCVHLKIVLHSPFVLARSIIPK